MSPGSLIARFVAGVLLALCSLFTAAHARTPHMEVTPWVGYRLGGEFRTGDDGTSGRSETKDGGSFGLDAGLYRDPESYYQVFYGRRDAGLQSADEGLRGLDVRIEYLHFGGTLLFPQPRGYSGYFSATIGLTRIAAQSTGYDTERKFSASLGGGARFPWTDRLQAVAGIRAYHTFMDRDSELVCVSGDGEAGCLLRSSGRGFWELEALVGLAFRF